MKIIHILPQKNHDKLIIIMESNYQVGIMKEKKKEKVDKYPLKYMGCFKILTLTFD